MKKTTSENISGKYNQDISTQLSPPHGQLRLPIRYYTASVTNGLIVVNVTPEMTSQLAEWRVVAMNDHIISRFPLNIFRTSNSAEAGTYIFSTRSLRRKFLGGVKT